MSELGLVYNRPFKKSARIVGECFVKDTLVATERGLVPIQDVCRDDKVYTEYGLQPVRELYEMPPQALFEIELDNGLRNVATPSQMFRVFNSDFSDSWKEAKDLASGDWVILRTAFPSVGCPLRLSSYKGMDKVLSRRIAYLLGLLMSDGWVAKEGKRRRLGFYSAEREMMEQVVSYLQEEFGYAPTIEVKDNSSHVTTKGVPYKPGYTVRINKDELNRFFTENFGLAEISAPTKFIPSQIFQSPKNVVFAFLSGLIDGDGSIHRERNVIHYGSISQTLIEQLQILLHHLGIPSQRRAQNYGNSKRQTFHWLEITGTASQRLAESLDLAHPEKRQNLTALKHGLTKQLQLGQIPYAGKTLFEELSQRHIGSGWYQSTDGTKFRQGIAYPGGAKIRYSSDLWEKPLYKQQVVEWGIMDKLERIGSSFAEKLAHFFNEDISFVQVKRVVPHAPEITYDIQVTEDHSFVANGMVVHNCLGKYHPHGDTAVYDTMVRMAQDFSLRYPLVNGQGNFGSIDGDPPAAMRYTEARLARIAGEMLKDLEKNTVGFVPNFDESLQEPSVLPSLLPNLLVNGSSGIAVGMATNIPPHNLSEVVDGLIALLKDEDITNEKLMKYIKAPDFPTAGIIIGYGGVKEAYTTGRGRLTLRARANIETGKNDRQSIVISEIPYQVNKANLIEKIAELVRDKKIEDISDIRDESDRDGMRVVVELKRDAIAKVVLNNLFKHTQMETTFGVIMLALVDGRPQVLTLKEVMRKFLDHRLNVIVRRTKFDLDAAERRAHILEGYIIALDNIDEVIALIKKSRDVPMAQTGLMRKFKLSEIQAKAILDMRLQRLTGLERKQIEDEYRETIKLIEKLKAIFKSKQLQVELIKEELLELKKKYGDERRTEVIHDVEDFSIEDLIAEEDVVITISHGGFIKRFPVSGYRRQIRGGRGVTGAATREDDFVEHMFVASTHQYIMFFTDKGRCLWLKVHEVPEGGRASRGRSVVNLIEKESDENITAFLSVKEFDEEHYVVMVTKYGVIKKTVLSAFGNPRSVGIIAITLDRGDRLVDVRLTDGTQDIVIGTREGMAIRFSENDVRDMGRTAGGVRAINLGKGDEVVGMIAIKRATGSILVCTDKGFGKRSEVNEYRLTRRGGKGVITVKSGDKNGKMIAIREVQDTDDLVVVTAKGMIMRQHMSDVRLAGRNTMGVRLIKLSSGDSIAAVANVTAEEESEGEDEEKTTGKKQKELFVEEA
jgi:DNA gyrase subunit A